MRSYRARKSGFTLVEILIVVIILGILAAIVIPQFTNASQDARESSLRSQLQSMRSQIALYKLQHRDTPPLMASFWSVMNNCTDEDGTVKTVVPINEPDGTYKFGPYFENPVVNPLANSSTLDDAAGTANTGWIYNEDTGALSATADATGAAFAE